ncbi:MAG TPA: co-chaperone GroES [Nitrospirota bacterium]|nr:co-chaperone GroES [Nitrospirota bacterium]
MKIQPLHDWAVIRPSAAEEMTESGLYIPDTAKDKPNEGVVEAIGPGAYEEEKHGKKKKEGKERKFIPTTIKPGDRVLYERYGGQTVKIENEERILVRERDILGVLTASSSGRREPLLIPANTSSSQVTSLGKLAMTAITTVPEKKTLEKKSVGGGKGKARTKKAMRKTAKKIAKKAAKKIKPKKLIKSAKKQKKR